MTVLVAAVFSPHAVAYLCITVAALLPVFLWLRGGARELPMLPVISGLFYVYYAIPLLRGEITTYTTDEIVYAAVTVGSFLVSASVACSPFLGRGSFRPASASRTRASDRLILRMIALGLGAGITFHLAVLADALGWLGSALGLVRALMLSLASLASYLLGHARASGLLRHENWALAVGALLILILLALGDLLLIAGLMYCLAGFLGYVVTAKRIPWISVTAALAVMAVLHAGKLEVRRIYWPSEFAARRGVSIGQFPSMMGDWFTTGVDALTTGRADTDILDRASLLHMVLLVQRTTPEVIPYLKGETYALLPSMLLPRFIESEKSVSQSVLNLLSIRYGLQSDESVRQTTIGWGLVAEAYANFGHPAVIAAGLVFGALCGVLMWLSAAVAPNTPLMFIAIAASLVLLNLEADFAYLMTTMAQTVAALLLAIELPMLLRRPRQASVARRAARFGVKPAPPRQIRRS